MYLSVVHAQFSLQVSFGLAATLEQSQCLKLELSAVYSPRRHLALVLLRLALALTLALVGLVSHHLDFLHIVDPRKTLVHFSEVSPGITVIVIRAIRRVAQADLFNILTLPLARLV